MSDTMLLGVLRMPPSLWVDTDIDKQQRYGRYLQAANKIESLQSQCDALQKVEGMSILDAPCIFCNYKGLNYYQSGSHLKNCPWYCFGSKPERKRQLSNVLHEMFKRLTKANDKTEQLEKELQEAREGIENLSLTFRPKIERLEQQLSRCREENERLNKLVNTPELVDFSKAVITEAAHQRERWGEEHDLQKTDDDWFWTLCYLATKATQANRYGDKEKYLHHLITAAALLNNWHAQARDTLAEIDKTTPPQET